MLKLILEAIEGRKELGQYVTDNRYFIETDLEC